MISIKFSSTSNILSPVIVISNRTMVVLMENSTTCGPASKSAYELNPVQINQTKNTPSIDVEYRI